MVLNHKDLNYQVPALRNKLPLAVSQPPEQETSSNKGDILVSNFDSRYFTSPYPDVGILF